jgi:CDP-diacylglycerol---glycerol-3-phosphate 3-phosphatidyltransferase
MAATLARLASGLLIAAATVSDVSFTYVTGALWIVLFVAYGVRVATAGAYRSERAAGVGGTAIMGQNMMQATYWGLDPIVRALVAMRLTANGVTTIALVLGIAAGVAVALGWFGLACLLSTVSTLCDILDGQVARMTSTGSDRGELFDAVVDRYTEFALIGGFVIYAHATWWLVVVALLALQASYMISYASAKAEALQVKIPRGLMRRHERAAVLTLVAGMTPLLGPAIHERWAQLPETTVFVVGCGLVALIGGVAGVLRFTWIRAALRGQLPSVAAAK